MKREEIQVDQWYIVSTEHGLVRGEVQFHTATGAFILFQLGSGIPDGRVPYEKFICRVQSPDRPEIIDLKAGNRYYVEFAYSVRPARLLEVCPRVCLTRIINNVGKLTTWSFNHNQILAPCPEPWWAFWRKRS